jgi:outer membrane protein OmpA-like peptidoglycan-associated protein
VLALAPSPAGGRERFVLPSAPVARRASRIDVAPTAVRTSPRPVPIRPSGVAIRSAALLTPSVVSVPFAFASSAITARRQRMALRSAVALWRSLPAGEALRIDGHADIRGSDAYNDALGRRRAAAVRRALQRRGVPHDLLVIRSFGRRRPCAPNRTPSGRARNRRVDVYGGVRGGRAVPAFAAMPCI